MYCYIQAQQKSYCLTTESLVQVNANIHNHAMCGIMSLDHHLSRKLILKLNQQKYLDSDSGLVVGSCGKYLWFLCRNDSVSWNQLRHNAANGLDTHRQRINIKKNEVASVFLSTKHTSLNCCSIRHCLVWVYTSARLLPQHNIKQLDRIGLCSVLRPLQHSIGYMGDGFYRSKDPTNSIRVLKEATKKNKNNTKNIIHIEIRNSSLTDWAVFYVPSNTVLVIRETIRIYNTANPLVYSNMRWLGDSSHRGQVCQAWTAVGPPPQYPPLNN